MPPNQQHDPGLLLRAEAVSEGAQLTGCPRGVGSDAATAPSGTAKWYNGYSPHPGGLF
jgi:hypothetical protein